MAVQLAMDWEQFIKDRTAVRILCIVYRNSPFFESAEAQPIMQAALSILLADESKLLTFARWPRISTLVFDLYHTSYDFGTAHNPENIPVISIQFRHASQKIRVGVVTGEKHKEVNQKVAQLHSSHGYGPLPIIENHLDGNVPVYLTPRFQIRLQSGTEKEIGIEKEENRTVTEGAK